MNFYETVLDAKDALMNKTKELLSIPSVLDKFDENSKMPFGKDINKALFYMLDLGKEDGFITKNIKNYAGHIEFGEGKEIIGVLCHLDVVPAGDGWRNPPFDPVIKDDKIYARGANDDKGPTMAAYFALKLLKESGFKPKKRIRIILGTDEETAWRGINKYFETEEMPTVGFAPDAMFPLIYGEKGIFSFDITGQIADDTLVSFEAGDRYNVVPDKATCIIKKDLKEVFENYLTFNNFKGEVDGDTYTVYGKRAHAMQPNVGVNAAFILAQFLNKHIDNNFIKYINTYLTFDYLGEKLKIDHHDDEMKEFTMNPAVFQYDGKEFKIGINCRFPKGWNKTEAIEKIKASIKPNQFAYTNKTDMPVHYVEKEDSLVQTLLGAYRKYTGDQTEPITIGGGTYARSLKKAVAFGPLMPGREEVAHQVDEDIMVEDVLTATAIYMESLYQLTKEA
ncbi:MAG: dipeptidase PepV [Candidatus Izimaplasma sp.]|nr:dipeptidase PepV [Candidatus Izimaplasma bacterium]